MIFSFYLKNNTYVYFKIDLQLVAETGVPMRSSIGLLLW